MVEKAAEKYSRNTSENCNGNKRSTRMRHQDRGRGGEARIMPRLCMAEKSRSRRSTP
jgi:hypothetical protein